VDRLRSLGPPTDEPTVKFVLVALGVFHLGEGIWQLVAPASFYDVLGHYGPENTHYVGDVGAFVIAFGIALLLAASRPSWRVPLLYLGALWYGFHALNHLFDIGEARSDLRGTVDTLLLALGAALLAGLARALDRAPRE
jgi:hypothetical protein